MQLELMRLGFLTSFYSACLNLGQVILWKTSRLNFLRGMPVYSKGSLMLRTKRIYTNNRKLTRFL